MVWLSPDHRLAFDAPQRWELDELGSQALQFLPLGCRAKLEVALAEPAPAAAQLAGGMGPTRVLGMTAGTVAAVRHGRAEFLKEDDQLRRTEPELAVLQLAHQVLLERPAARTLGQPIDQLRQLSVQFLDGLENTQGSESGRRFRRQPNAEAVG